MSVALNTSGLSDIHILRPQDARYFDQLFPIFASCWSCTVQDRLDNVEPLQAYQGHHHWMPGGPYPLWCIDPHQKEFMKGMSFHKNGSTMPH